jgi:bifunctional UDP-N-acetylglucosamine pyrophosphorylase/glucosamine-1-phosphate N-acetyltransferase
MTQANKPFAIAIMAAGKGTRMKSENTAKVLHTLAGRSLIMHVLRTAFSTQPEQVYPIIGHCAEAVQAHILDTPAPIDKERLHFVEQQEQLGTGHAIMQLKPYLEGFQGELVILNGDVPLLSESTLRQLLDTHNSLDYAATLLTTHVDNPSGYGRIIRHHQQFVKITEDKEATHEEKAIREINTGVYVFSWPILSAALDQLTNDNAKGEYYLTDVIAMLVSDRRRLGTVTVANPQEVLGINSRKELADMETILRTHINHKWMLEGVTLRDPASIYIDCDVEIGSDTEILPGTLLQGQTRIGRHCLIGPHTTLVDAQVGDQVKITQSVVQQAELQDGVQVGPFAHLRPETVLEAHSKVGNFVELKKTRLGVGAKASHLSYLGDAEIGAASNIGAGVITCNYDGARKHRTIIGENVFVGSNSTLVAPLLIEPEAFIGAGSVITDNVPAGSLGLGRSRQVNKDGWSATRRPRKA